MFAREVDLALLQTAIPPSPENGDVNSEGRFRIAGVSGRVRLFGGGAGWFVRRVLLRGADVTTSGFDVNRDVDGIEVILTDRATIVTGTVRDAGGNSRNDFIVAFFPVGQFDREQQASRQRTIRPDLDGVYRIRGLPAGDYLAAAVPAISLPIDGEWDPAFFARIRPMATSFKLSVGQTFALNLPLIE